MSKFEASRKLQVHGNLASRGRWAVATLFFVNGFLVGSWAPQIPLVLGRLSISETTLGLLILVFGLGAFVAMPSAGLAMSRYGSRRVLRVVALVACAGLVPVVAATDVIAVAVALFVFGASIGAMDVAMNTNAVVVERRLGRAVMSSSHGFWSLGGFAGGGLCAPGRYWSGVRWRRRPLGRSHGYGRDYLAGSNFNAAGRGSAVPISRRGGCV